MQRPHSTFAVYILLSVLTFVAAGISVVPAYAGEKQVEVVNDSARPVPVTVENGVSLQGGTVQAEQSGAWSVSVENGPDGAIPVRPPARQPVQFEITVPLGSLLQNVEDAFTVPEGKRLVIEYISTSGRSGLVDLPNAAAFRGVVITRLSSPGNFFDQTYLLTAATPIETEGPALRVWGSSEMVKIYARSGTTVRMGARRSFDPNGATLDIRIAASGYLEDEL